jgi:hypothetical protein
MNSATNHQRRAGPRVPAARQGKLGLVVAERWEQLRDGDRQACRRALALLLHEVISQREGNTQDER